MFYDLAHQPESAATAPTYPDNNPKTLFGLAKPGIRFIPPSALIYLGQAMAEGARKYGPMNWREKKVSTSVYYDAGMRHRMRFWDGEDFDPESGFHHLAHSMACDAIILDALTVGNLNDDRPFPGNVSELIQTLTKKD